MLDSLIAGFSNILQPISFLFMLFGVVTGIIIGALPGLSGSMGIILLLPLVYRLPGDIALVMLCGLFCGSMYGGSISAILLKTPGTPSAAATVLDGYPLAEKGMAGKAIGVSSVASFIGGMLSTLCMIFIAPQLAKVALEFQAADYFSLALFGITIMAGASGKNITKGLISGFIGLLISTVGIDPIIGNARFTFGTVRLMSGFDILPILIGVFALSEAISKLESDISYRNIDRTYIKGIIPSWTEFRSILKVTLIGGILGVLIGIIPGTGGAIACFLAYNVARKVSRHPEEFGHGSLEGIAAPEAANNGTTGGALIPMLTLGIPGDVVTSVMLGALVLIGVRPGPTLFLEKPELVYTIFAGMFLIQFLMLGLGFLFARFSPAILRIPSAILMPIIVILCAVGTYSIGNQSYHIMIALAFAVLGYLMKRFDFPGAPLVLGVILGPIAEENLARALLISGNDYSIFVRRPISLCFLILSVLSIVWAISNQKKPSNKETQEK